MSTSSNTSTNTFQSLFTSQQGQFPKILYIAPVFLWLIVGSVLIAAPTTITTSIYGVNTIVPSYALDLQEDINFMSTQVQGLQLFDLSKKEIISDNSQENFLLEKARRKLEKSPMAQSEGRLDNENLVFDSALNAMVVLPPQQNALMHQDSFSNQHPTNYNPQNQYQKYQDQYQQQEVLRKQQIEQAKADNRKRRLALENDHIDYAAQAYEQGVIDQNRRYNQFHGIEANETSSKKSTSKKRQSSSSSRTASKATTPALSFNTATGQKNNFINSSRDKRTKSVSYSPTLSSQLSNSPINDPLIATIDKADKVRSGDKVQIRILKDGIYRGMTIPQDVILYGICRVNQNRIDISVPSISINGQLIRTNLIAYDMDGIKGIYVDGKFNDFTKDMVQEGLNASNSVGGNGLGVRSPLGNVSLKLGRKANNRNRVHIPSAYQILLYDGAPEEVQQEVNQQQINPTFSNY